MDSFAAIRLPLLRAPREDGEDAVPLATRAIAKDSPPDETLITGIGQGDKEALGFSFAATHALSAV